MSKETGGPAFPQSIDLGDEVQWFKGMTMRQYAAIKLKVPDSGIDWLDGMIRQSLKNDFAAKAMQGFFANGQVKTAAIVKSSYMTADAMLKAREA